MARIKLPTPEGPSRQGTIDGLAYTMFEPKRDPLGGVIVLHGAGSCKESHHDFARAARDSGYVAIAFDMRGHGASKGALDTRAIDDVATIASLLDPRLPVVLRGSSMGGFLALVAAVQVNARAVIAICPAPADLLLRGLRSGTIADFRYDADALLPWLETASLEQAVESYTGPLILLHAEGDERVPVAGTRRLHELSISDPIKLIVAPGGTHRSVQHDPELQGLALRFVTRALH